jgi:phenylalanyl-tRNA synthetase alpha chain
LHEYEIAVLELLKKKENAELADLSSELQIAKDKAMWAVESLRSAGLVGVERREEERYLLTEEAKSYIDEMPEEALARRAKQKPVRLDGSVNRVALLWAKRNGWIEISAGTARATQKWDKEAKTQKYLQRSMLQRASKDNTGSISADTPEWAALENLIKRGLVHRSREITSTLVRITSKGAATKTGSNDIGTLDRETIVTERWRKQKLRHYDVHSDYERLHPARLHPMREFINIVRNAWLGMGFMETSGPIIESAFWNFDALFSPQDHPTRDMHDTYFLSNPKYIDIGEIGLLNKVRKMQMKGWREGFNENLAKEALLRTHTTPVSARNIRKYAELSAENYPVKLFSIGKVFRNETIDYKHLVELHQTDGIIIGDNLSLSNLIDTLKRFWTCLGIEGIKFKPSYFPFTEPSLEISVYDEGLGEDVELAGAGIIREEITRALGTSKTVLAWGFGLDRMLTRFIKVDTLSDLYKNNIEWLREREELRV